MNCKEMEKIGWMRKVKNLNELKIKRKESKKVVDRGENGEREMWKKRKENGRNIFEDGNGGRRRNDFIRKKMGELRDVDKKKKIGILEKDMKRCMEDKKNKKGKVFKDRKKKNERNIMRVEKNIEKKLGKVIEEKKENIKK